MTTSNVVFLFDVDNTLLDNDRVTADLKGHLESEVGSEGRQRYFALFEELRTDLGYADYLGALQCPTLDIEARLGRQSDVDMKTSRMAQVLLSCIICLTMQAERVAAQASSETEVTRIEKFKKRLSESTKDPKSRIEVRLKGNRRITGQLGEMRDDGFILNEASSGRPILIAYQDIGTIKNKKQSSYTKLGLAALIGGTALLTIVAIVATANGQ
jgi:hypothetical protein